MKTSPGKPMQKTVALVISYGNHPWFPPLLGSYSLRQFVPDKLVAITLQISGLT